MSNEIRITYAKESFLCNIHGQPDLLFCACSVSFAENHARIWRVPTAKFSSAHRVAKLREVIKKEGNSI